MHVYEAMQSFMIYALSDAVFYKGCIEARFLAEPLLVKRWKVIQSFGDFNANKDSC
jgi:hypothetical protein